MGLWKPTPKDIFRSRWKKFYKRTYRARTKTNTPDRPGPHPQPINNPDGVPSPWRLLYSNENFDPKLPPDMKSWRYGPNGHYAQNMRTFMRPMQQCQEGAVRDCILRSLDPGRRGGTAADSGLGRAELTPWGAQGSVRRRTAAEEAEGRKIPEHLPEHIYNAVKAKSVELEGQEADAERGLAFLDRLTTEARQNQMPVRRLQELVDEYEMVWENGQNNPRAGNNRNKPQDEAGIDRGRFPFIDEQAGLLDELNLKEILRLNYKTKSRHHPKWREIRYDFKKGHIQYLRRREMNRDEEKARMGIMRKTLQDA